MKFRYTVPSKRLLYSNEFEIREFDKLTPEVVSQIKEDFEFLKSLKTRVLYKDAWRVNQYGMQYSMVWASKLSNEEKQNSAIADSDRLLDDTQCCFFIRGNSEKDLQYPYSVFHTMNFLHDQLSKQTEIDSMNFGQINTLQSGEEMPGRVVEPRHQPGLFKSKNVFLSIDLEESIEVLLTRLRNWIERVVHSNLAISHDTQREGITRITISV